MGVHETDRPEIEVGTKIMIMDQMENVFAGRVFRWTDSEVSFPTSLCGWRGLLLPIYIDLLFSLAYCCVFRPQIDVALPK